MDAIDDQTGDYMFSLGKRVGKLERDLAHLESVAIEHRFDLAAAREELKTAAAALQITKGTRVVSGLDVGVPILAPIADQSVAEGDLVSFTATANAARTATSVLPNPTSPQTSLSIGRGVSRSTFTSSIARCWSGASR